MYKELLCLFWKWETEAWKIKEVGPRKRSYIPLPSHGNCFILTLIWPYADSPSFLSKVSFCFFSVSTWRYSTDIDFIYPLFSSHWNLTALCLEGTMPPHQWLQGPWILNVELLGPFHMLPFLNPGSLSLLSTLPVTLQHPLSVSFSALTEWSTCFL